MQTESGTPKMHLKRKVQRFGFVPLGFASAVNEKSIYTLDNKIEEVVTMQQTSLK